MKPKPFEELNQDERDIVIRNGLGALRNLSVGTPFEYYNTEEATYISSADPYHYILPLEQPHVNISIRAIHHLVTYAFFLLHLNRSNEQHRIANSNLREAALRSWLERDKTQAINQVHDFISSIDPALDPTTIDNITTLFNSIVTDNNEYRKGIRSEIYERVREEVSHNFEQRQLSILRMARSSESEPQYTPPTDTSETIREYIETIRELNAKLSKHKMIIKIIIVTAVGILIASHLPSWL